MRVWRRVIWESEEDTDGTSLRAHPARKAGDRPPPGEGRISIDQTFPNDVNARHLHIAGTYFPFFTVKRIRERSSRPERSFSVQL